MWAAADRLLQAAVLTKHLTVCPDSWVFHCLMGSQVTAVGTRGSGACHPHQQNDLLLQRWCRFQNAEIQSEGQLKCSERRFDWQLSCVCLSLRNKHWVMAEMKINAFSSPPYSPHHPNLHPPPLNTWQESLKSGGKKVLTKTWKKKNPQIFSYRPPTRDIFIRQSQSPQRVQLILACGETNLCQLVIAHLWIKPCKPVSEFRLKGKKVMQNHFPWHSSTPSVKSRILPDYYYQSLRGSANTLELHRLWGTSFKKI